MLKTDTTTRGTKQNLWGVAEVRCRLLRSRYAIGHDKGMIGSKNKRTGRVGSDYVGVGLTADRPPE